MDEYFNLIQFPTINPPPSSLIHVDAQDELLDLYRRSGQKGMLAAHLKRRLMLLEERLHQAPVFKSDWFEILEPPSNHLYAIRFLGAGTLGNLRIIYDIKGSNPRLLVAFQEKNKSDYAPAIEAALNRSRD